jgi:hypothetical protein
MTYFVRYRPEVNRQPARYTAFASDTSRSDDTRHACFAGTSEKSMPESEDSR